jgi:hypothetical protein
VSLTVDIVADNVEDEATLAAAVRCPVCNSPVVSGEPAGWFRVRCRRKGCRTLIEIRDAAFGVRYSSGPARVRTSEEAGPCLP